MGDPTRPGDLVGEPSPLLDSIHVLREHLTIDMRSCSRLHPATGVDATYKLRNDGIAKTLDLVFIAGMFHQDSVGSFIVLLDDVPVPARFVDSLPVPLSWTLPQYTPALNGKDSLPYHFTVRNDALFDGMKTWPKDDNNLVSFPTATPAILFSLHLPAGEHTIRVTYTADATGYGYGDLVYIWQFGYVLAPARRWGSFGGLDAEVLVPDGWEVASWPAMKRSGDTLFGSWNTLPADAIAVSTKIPVSQTKYWIAEHLPISLAILLILLLSFRLGWKKGKTLGMEGRSLAGAIPLALFCAILGFILLGAGLAATDFWMAGLLRGQRLPDYGWFVTLPFMMIGSFFTPYGLIFLIPSGVALLGAGIARSKTLQVAPPEPPESVLR